MEEIGKMRRLFEAQAIADHGDIPVGVFEQGLGLGKHSKRDMFRGGLTGDLFDGTVEVVDVYGKIFGIIAGGTEAELMGGGFDGELPFEELGKDGRDPGVSIRVAVKDVGGLHFYGVVHDFGDVIPQQVVLVYVVGVDLPEHFEKEGADFFVLFPVECIGGSASD